MIIYRLHFVFIILLLVNYSSGRKTFVTRAAHDIHQMAIHRTHSLARDLRIAFGGYFIRRADNQRVVYCKRGDQSPLVDGGSGNVSISKSPATATQSSSTPKSTTTSPWKLFKSYVCHNGLFLILYIYFSSFPQHGNNFFDAWDFYTDSDPTHGAFQPNIFGLFFSSWFAGLVNYVDEKTAVCSMIYRVQELKSEFDP